MHDDAALPQTQSSPLSDSPQGQGRPAASLPLGILDLSSVAEGSTSAAALASTTALAQWADAQGFERFWVAEHHNMPAVASTSPAVLMAHLAANTSRIKLGSGGVMLPNHPPLVVAEQFALLEALHPGRIELGIGRAPGTDPRTSAALRRSAGDDGVEQFPQHVLDILGLFGDPRGASAARFLAATPVSEGAPPLILLGSSRYSAHLAGQLGLGFSYAHHFGQEDPALVFEVYRSVFSQARAEDGLDAKPYAILATSAITGESEEHAQHLAGPSKVMALNLRRGNPAPIVSPEKAEQILADPQAQMLLEGFFPGTRFIGTGDQTAAQISEFAQRSGADALVLAQTMHEASGRAEEKIASLTRFLEAWRQI